MAIVQGKETVLGNQGIRLNFWKKYDQIWVTFDHFASGQYFCGLLVQ